MPDAHPEESRLRQQRSPLKHAGSCLWRPRG
jgi:hypothetical protein